MAKDSPNQLGLLDKVILYIGKWLKQSRCRHTRKYTNADKQCFCYDCDKRFKCTE